ncbi:MAG: hypothetical protein ACJ76Y_01350 [Thermoanaerobaculia bacterium]
MRRSLAGCLTLLGLLASAPLLADSCALDSVPAATLLLPYFEVDLSDPNGMTTLFSVNNASASAALLNVVVWSDLGVPTLGFPVYLTGYDVQTINLRDLFNGNLPGTATRGQDPADTLSPKGVYSQDLNFASCTGFLPLPVLPASFAAHLRAAHTGGPSQILGGSCAGQSFGDNVARGYVTVDTVNRCTLLTPADPGYFGPGSVATDQNMLWGDFLFVDPGNDYADGESLVRVESFPGRFKPGDLTFYGRYVGMSGADNREPLATTWASRYVNGGAFSGGTDLLVWRDSGRTVRPFPCGSPPGGFPLLLNREHVFDEQERATFVSASSPVPPPAGEQLPSIFPAEANRIKVGSASYPVPFDFGWLYADLNAPVQGGGRTVRQSWMGTVMKARGRYSVGLEATPLDSACAPAAPFVP